MRFSAVLLASALGLCATLPAQRQNLLVNGDFETGTATGWNVTAAGYNPQVELFDTTGLGTTWAYGSQLDQTHLVLAQQVALSAGVPYLLEADFAGTHPYSHTNGDGGRWEAWLGGVLLDSGALGGVPGFETRRRRICAVHVPSAGGTQALEIHVFRNYNASGVRSYVDNVYLGEASYPVVLIRDERKLGASIAIEVLGSPGALFVVYAGGYTLPAPGITLPGWRGTWWLDPILMIQLFTGTLPNTGAWRVSVPLPNDPSLAGAPLFLQGLELLFGGSISFGTVHEYTLIR